MNRKNIYGEIAFYCVASTLWGFSAFHSYHLGLHIMGGSPGFAAFMCFLLEGQPLCWMVYFLASADNKIQKGISSVMAGLNTMITIAAVSCNILYTSDLAKVPEGLGILLNSIVIFSFAVNTISVLAIKLSSGNAQGQKYFE